MMGSVALRRLIHCLVALAPLYYLLPPEMPGLPVKRWHILIAFFLIVVAFEAIRLRRRIIFLGLRPHERNSIASFAWAAAGITTALWLMPMEIATPVLIGMGLVDPLVGELRRKRSSSAVQISLPLAAYAIICFTMLSLMVDKEAASIITISTIGSLLAVGAERLDLPRVDDDFLMIIVPGSLMSIIWLMM